MGAAEETIKQAESEERMEEVSKRLEETAREEPAVLEAISTPIRPSEDPGEKKATSR